MNTTILMRLQQNREKLLLKVAIILLVIDALKLVAREDCADFVPQTNLKMKKRETCNRFWWKNFNCLYQLSCKKSKPEKSFSCCPEKLLNFFLVIARHVCQNFNFSRLLNENSFNYLKNPLRPLIHRLETSKTHRDHTKNSKVSLYKISKH